MPKCPKDCNTPKVLEIHNHECPVLFHRVMVPAAMGDDETNPPRNGQYRNVLLVYGANDHVYLFSSDGIPTFISDGKTGGVEDYEELLNKPLINGHELIGDSSLEDIGVTDAIDDALDDYTPTTNLSAVALSGDYDDLTNKPTIGTGLLTLKNNNVVIGTFSANSTSARTITVTTPTKTSDLTNDSGFLTSYTETDPIYSASPAAGITAADISSWDAKSDFSGSYNDLTDKPTIPTVNNATLTIQKNGTTVKTFTANASSNVTANITVPTQTSQLTNDSGFITDAGVTSFNGSTGAVTYTAPVTSVNGNTGAVTGLQTTSNLVTSVSSSSTNSQYPSAKLFYDTVGDVETILQTLNDGGGAQ